MIALPFVGIDVVLIVLWTIAAALAIALVMKKVGAVFNGVPVVGKYIADATSAVAQAITNACGSLMGGIESAVGGALHWVARHFDTWLNQFVSHAVVLAHLAQIVGNAVYDVSGLKALVRSVGYVAHTALRLVDKLEREFKGIEAGVKKLEREIATGIGHDLRIVVAGLEAEVTTLERKVVPELRRGIKAAEGEVTQLENFIKAIPGTNYLAWAAGIVAAGIATVGNGWLGCKENPFSSSENPCGLWANLARFMPFLGLLAIGFDFPTFVNAAELVAEGIGEAVGKIEGSFPLQLEPLPPPE